MDKSTVMIIIERVKENIRWEGKANVGLCHPTIWRWMNSGLIQYEDFKCHVIFEQRIKIEQLQRLGYRIRGLVF